MTDAHSDRSSPLPEVLFSQYEDINRRLESIEKKLDEKYVTTEQFWPVKTIVYGGAGIVMTAVLVAGLALIIRSSQTAGAAVPAAAAVLHYPPAVKEGS